jgi:hypothetical protein
MLAAVLSPGAGDDRIGKRGAARDHAGAAPRSSLRAGHRRSRRSCPTTLKPVPALAREVCAACHFVTEDQMIDPEMGPWSVDAARHPATTALRLRVFLQTPACRHARPHAERGGDGRRHLLRF